MFDINNQEQIKVFFLASLKTSTDSWRLKIDILKNESIMKDKLYEFVF